MIDEDFGMRYEYIEDEDVYNDKFLNNKFLVSVMLSVFS